jgi:hypothetical protein
MPSFCYFVRTVRVKLGMGALIKATDLFSAGWVNQLEDSTAQVHDSCMNPIAWLREIT